jgi:Tol biopolymer transport system component
MWLMNADGSNETALVPGSPQSWSADGNHLAFQRADAEGDLELFVLDFVVDDPPVERQLTFNSASDFRPDWHPAPR